MNRFLSILVLIVACLPHGAAHAANPVILIFGDSLSAGYGISRDVSWPNLLQASLKKDHPQYEVVNASISGETTSGGLRRIEQALQQHQPEIVILELGANDGLRGSPLSEMEKNLEALIERIRQHHAHIVLVGMQLPPNYGPDYTSKFRAIYPRLAKRHGLALIPFLLEGVKPDQFLPDNLHPDAAGQPQVLHNVEPKLRSLLNAK